ncbi:MAG: DMT family protein [Gammaproteobacteria bacterium]
MNHALLSTIGLLVLSNTFMTFAWYAHLKNYAGKPILFVIFISWGIALFEYIFQVPGNRIGYQQAGLSLAELKILQEVITLVVFMPFAVFYMKQPLNWNFVWAGVCMVGAVYFIFKT